MENTIVNLNGSVFSTDRIDEARVSVFDRSFIYGDSLYEVVRTYQYGKPYCLDAHLERLKQTAKLCKMELNQSLETYAQEIKKTLLAHPLHGQVDFYCRLVVSRGSGKIGFAVSNVTTPTLFAIIVFPLHEITEAQFEKGFHVEVSARLRNDPRALDPAMKSGNYLNSLLAYLEASEKDFDDALLCNGDGYLTEGTTFNLFYIKRNILVTPPLEIGILDGITRRGIIHCAQKLGMEVREIYFPKERLYEADEVFLSSTLKEVFPITRVDRKKIQNGKPGPKTRELKRVFREWIEARW